jgi:ferredoxin
MKIHINNDRCAGAGQCALNAPELFDQSEQDGTVVLLNEHPPSSLYEVARLAADLCPNTVIHLTD